MVLGPNIGGIPHGKANPLRVKSLVIIDPL
jgi:hypothetical protein